VPPPHTPFVQARPPQQAAPEAQAPPALRQQLSAPSLAMPLSAQIVVPPDWLHWDEVVQEAPAARPPPGAAPPGGVPPGDVLPPLQNPLTQLPFPQHPISSVQAPPAWRQQLVAPRAGSPLKAQSTAPPVCEHWPALSQAEPGGNCPVAARSVQAPFRQ
jgi:hypothetical protein